VCETSKLPHLLDNRLTDGGEALNWIDLAQERVERWDLLNLVMNLWVL
jgi:hypothetical protein